MSTIRDAVRSLEILLSKTVQGTNDLDERRLKNICANNIWWPRWEFQ